MQFMIDENRSFFLFPFSSLTLLVFLLWHWLGYITRDIHTYICLFEVDHGKCNEAMVGYCDTPFLFAFYSSTFVYLLACIFH